MHTDLINNTVDKCFYIAQQYIIVQQHFVWHLVWLIQGTG